MAENTKFLWKALAEDEIEYNKDKKAKKLWMTIEITKKIGRKEAI